MNLSPLWVLGLIGYVIVGTCALPQIIRLFRRKSADDVSLLRDVLLTSGVCFILVYASSVGDVVYFAGQVLTIILSGTIIGQVVWYRFLRPRRAGTKCDG